MTDVEVAKLLYETYCASSGNKNYRGDPCPAWEALPDAIRTHWTSVAKAAITCSPMTASFCANVSSLSRVG